MVNTMETTNREILTYSVNLTKVSIIISIIIGLIMWIVVAIGRSKCLKKAGDKGWKAFIPFYGTYLMYKISGMEGFWIIVNVISEFIGIIGFGIGVAMLIEMNDVIASISSSYKATKEINQIIENYAVISKIIEVFDLFVGIGLLALNIVWAIKFCKSFGKSGGYIAGMILVPFVFYFIIGLGDAKYIGDYKANNEEVPIQ